jgi:hypothetical protein
MRTLLASLAAACLLACGAEDLVDDPGKAVDLQRHLFNCTRDMSRCSSTDGIPGASWCTFDATTAGLLDRAQCQDVANCSACQAACVDSGKTCE